MNRLVTWRYEFAIIAAWFVGSDCGLTTSLTIYGFGLRGNSATGSIGKHRFRTKKHQKVNKSSQKTMAYLFGTRRSWVRISSPRPKIRCNRMVTPYFLSSLTSKSKITHYRGFVRRASENVALFLPPSCRREETLPLGRTPSPNSHSKAYLISYKLEMQYPASLINCSAVILGFSSIIW